MRASSIFSLALFVSLAACSSSSSSTPSTDGGASSTSDGGGSPGSDAGGGSLKLACYYDSQHTCGAETFGGSAAVGVARDQCTNGGGTASDTCPADNLLGCCTQSTLQTCYYVGAPQTAAEDQTNCAAGHGTWSTSP